MHLMRIIVFFLAAFKIASCLDDRSVDYVNWYVPHFCEILANSASLARVSKVPLAQRSPVLQPRRALLSKTARSRPPVICNLQLQLQLPRALFSKTARSRPPVICNLQLHLQCARALLLKTARSRPPPVRNLQLHLQSPRALLLKTARLASPFQSKLRPLSTSRPLPAPLNLEQPLQ